MQHDASMDLALTRIIMFFYRVIFSSKTRPHSAVRVPIFLFFNKIIFAHVITVGLFAHAVPSPFDDLNHVAEYSHFFGAFMSNLM